MSKGASMLREWPRSLFNSHLPLPPRCCGNRRLFVANLSFKRYSSVAAAELQFGQPLHETHPHLLKAGELTPGITALEYFHRRSNLASKLPKNAIAIVKASEVKYKSKSVFYKYHQDPDFFYLTGFNEPSALAIIANTGPDGSDHTFHLYVREKDARAELWEGARSGTQAATDVFNADEAGDINKIKDILPDIITGASEIYSDIKGLDSPRSPFARLLSSLTPGSGASEKEAAAQKIKPLRPLLNGLRVFKSEAEIANMRKAGQASGRAFTETMKHSFGKEADLNAFLEYQFRVQGADDTAFVPVVAGGRNALSIHYVRNDNILRNDELVLVDGGSSYGGYISDITRVWPVNGKFAPAQRELYEAVLNVQRKCVSICRQSADVSLDKIHEVAEAGLREQLTSLGIDTSGTAMQTLFPHHVGHYIGLDVHDTGEYSRREKLLTGQCITIEPGVYVPDNDRWPEKYRGIGIRIEDSVCIGDDNPLVFTTEAVKEIDDIEALSRRPPLANVSNTVNSPLLAVAAPTTTSTTTALKRQRPTNSQCENDCPQPPLKKQLVGQNATNYPKPLTQRPANTHIAVSKLFTRRNSGHLSPFEKKLVAAKEKPLQDPACAKVSKSYCPQSIETVRQWQKHYRKAFPNFVFFFENVSEEARKKYVRQIVGLGAREEKFFSKAVTHVVTTRPIPQELDSPKYAEEVAAFENGNTVNPSLLEKNGGSTLQGRTRSKSGLGMIHPDPRKGSNGNADVLQRARQMHMKIWPLDKFQRIIYTMNDKEIAQALQPNRTTTTTTTRSKIGNDLSVALKNDRMLGPHESDALANARAQVHTKGPYLYVRDFFDRTRPLTREYAKVAKKRDGAWPQFQAAEIGKCAFVAPDASKQNEVKNVVRSPARKDQAGTKNASATASKTMAPPATGARQVNNKHQDRVENAPAPGGTGRESKDTTDKSGIMPKHVSKPFTFGTVPAGARFGCEPAASGIQPSHITSAIRSQMISSTAAGHGAKAGTSKEVHELKRKVLEKSNGIVSMATASSSHKLDAGVGNRPTGAPVTRAAKLKAQESFHVKKATIAQPSVQSRSASSKKSITSDKPKREPKAGYCENCKEKFDDFEEHITTRKHRKFALNDKNFEQVDDCFKDLQRQKIPPLRDGWRY
ncbi:hypothetical protein FQN57_004339 [Myotisia sp. PD_48]|nr:hypothetical protein FQN57_004339 [Myotisia sp. PD_48]